MRILVAEDNKTIAQNLKTVLVDEHFAVDLVHDGKQAYALASTEEYDALIVDIMMPYMDGIEVCMKLREEKNSVPILLLTAKDSVKDKVTGLDSGADDYLIKPFSFDELLARLRSLLRRISKEAPVLRVENLELNPATHIVKRFGKTITLTSKEYALLEYLMRHQNQILTREQILSHVWDFSYDSFSNVVDVIIRRLRNKIDRSFPSNAALISTIRGIGYKIGENSE